MFEIKNFLQEEAKPSYLRGGNIYAKGDATQKAAKNAAKIARDKLNEISPEIRTANNLHTKLHRLEEALPKNILGEDKAGAGLVSAGAGSNKRLKGLIKRLDETAGTNLGEQAELLAGMQYFGKPSMSNVLSTGKSLMGTVVGAAGGVPGAVAGAAISSPMAWKSAIKAGRIPDNVIKSVTGAKNVTKKAIDLFVDIASSDPGLTAQYLTSRAAGESKRSGLLENKK
jgi:hypothetical protein